MDQPPNEKVAVFGAGCFWCVEAVFLRLKGVLEVTPGYTGGRVPFPTYKEVCTGSTGHAEVARILFDPHVIDFDELLKVFWSVHDPTTKDRQGEDVGSQYRSVIFFTGTEQERAAKAYLQRLSEGGVWPAPIVTEVLPLIEFFPAEDYHHNYYANNPDQGYCRLVVRPKVEKFERVFHHRLKKEGLA
jgi:peptide-methionine (S)-S-oxide reductase